jgi:hypothetical protein
MALLGQQQQFERPSGLRTPFSRPWCRPLLAKIMVPGKNWRHPAQSAENAPQQQFWQSPDMAAIIGDAHKAQEMYRGIFDFADQRIVTTTDQLFQPATGGPLWTEAAFSLDWLSHFAAHPKKLTACFAATLLQAWIDGVSRGLLGRSQGIAQEAERLRVMQSCIPVLSNHVVPSQQHSLWHCWNIQLERLKATKPQNDSEAAQQALALARAALAVENPGYLLSDGLRRLEVTLAKSVHGDGGPVASTVHDHQGLWLGLSHLEVAMGQRDMNFSPTLATYRDRIAGFLAMFQRSNGSTAFGLAEDIDIGRPAIPSTAIQRMAAQSGLARLCHGRCVLIASNGAGFAAPRIDVSIGKSPLLAYACMPTANLGQNMEMTEVAEGSLVEFGRRQIFMASSGASIALPDRSHWQISVRGGHLKLADNAQDLQLICDGEHGTMNWAIKRMADDRPGRSAKSPRTSASSLPLLL